MDYQEQAGKNFLWLTIAQAGVRVLGIAFYLFLAYKLLDEGLGQYNFISSFVPFWFIIIDFGGGDYLYREWAKRQPEQRDMERDFDILFTVRFCITTAVFFVFLGVNYFVNREVLLPLALFYLSSFISMFLHLYDLSLQSRNLFRYTAVRQIIEKTVTVTVGATLLFFNASLLSVFGAILIAQVASAVYYYRHVVSMKIRFVFDWARSKDLFLRGLPFMFIAIFASIYSRIDMVMLRYLKDFETVGWYGAAYKFLDISSLFSVLFTTSIFPLLANLYSDPAKREEYTAFYYRGLRIIFSSGVVIALVFIFFAPLMVGVLFPESFGPSVLTLRILMIAQVLLFLSIFFNNLLLIQNRERRGLVIVIFSAALNVGLNFILIPKFSLYGAAWATVIAEASNLLLLQRFVHWEKDAKLLGVMGGVVVVNSALLLGLKHFGLMNNVFVGTFILFLNVVLFLRVKLLERADFVLFLKPIKTKMTAYFGAHNELS